MMGKLPTKNTLDLLLYFPKLAVIGLNAINKNWYLYVIAIIILVLLYGEYQRREGGVPSKPLDSYCDPNSINYDYGKCSNRHGGE